MTRKPTFWISLGITAFMLFALLSVFNFSSNNNPGIVLNSATQQAIDLQPVEASISAEQAASIAQNEAGIQPSAAAELVNYQGTAAYEVPFTNGNIYVDAASGSLLYNELSQSGQAQISPEQAAQVAAGYLQRNDVVRVQALLANGVEVYRVDFTSGDVVIVDTQGRILLVQLASSNQQFGEEHEENERDDD